MLGKSFGSLVSHGREWSNGVTSGANGGRRQVARAREEKETGVL
jgi:hypothetical protein